MKSIVKLSSGESWLFYHCKENGLCFSLLNSSARMGESCTLSPESPDDFDVICDNNDNIHLCCQDSNGDVLYFRYCCGEWKKSVVLKSKSGSTKRKQFKLFSVNGWLSMIFVLEYRDRNMLVHYIPDKGDGTPEVIDYIGECYTASIDRYSNIHVFYDSETNSAFGCKSYIWSQKSWGEFSPCPSYDNCNTILALYNDKNELAVITSKNKEIRYRTDAINKIISTGKKPIFFYDNDNIIVQWKYRDKIYGALSKNGVEFQKSGEYFINKDCTAEIYRISSNTSTIVGDYCYGYISQDKVHLLGMEQMCRGTDIKKDFEPIEIKNEYMQIKSNDSRDDALNKILISLNTISVSISSMEKHIVKCEDKLSDLEDKIKELSCDSSKKRGFIRR